MWYNVIMKCVICGTELEEFFCYECWIAYPPEVDELWEQSETFMEELDI